MNTIVQKTTLRKDDDIIDLQAYWRIFKKYSGSIFGLTILITLLVALYTFSLTPIYRATTQLLVETQQANVISIEEIYNINQNSEFFQTQIVILKSHQLIKKLIERLNLTQHRLFDPKRKETSGIKYLVEFWKKYLPPDVQALLTTPNQDEVKLSKSKVIEQVMDNLTIKAIRNTQIIEISYESPDPELAAAIPNTLAQIYIESDLDARLEMTQQAASWLTDRLAELREKLEYSENKLQTYMDQQGLVDASGIKSVAISELEGTTTNLSLARQELAKSRAIYKQIQALKGKPLSAYESIPTVLNHALVQAVKQLEIKAQSKVQEFKKKYGVKHPKMIAAQAELDAAKKSTEQEIKKVVAALTQEYQAVQARVGTLSGTLIRNKQEIQDLNRKAYQLNLLKRDVATNRQLYDLFLTRFKETDATQNESIKKTIGRVVDFANVPELDEPYKPKKALILAISLVLGFMFATLLAFLREHLDNTLHHVHDVAEKLGLPVLGMLPKLMQNRRDKFKTHLTYVNDNQSHFSESVRTIRTSILLSAVDIPNKIIAVTSSVAGEGKTTFAINQACALGQMKKTLLIDADMRRSTIARVFGIWKSKMGLSEIVSGSCELEQGIHTLEDYNIDLIPSGMVPPNPLELLSSQRFKELIATLQQRYQFIVIDAPPIHAVSDAMVIATHATEVVYIIKASATPYQSVLGGLDYLERINAKVLGVVLNQLDLKKTTYYYGKYVGYYGHYESYASKE